MDIINELWYGNVSPFEQCTRGDKRLKELLKLVVRNREELDGTLTEKQKETLEKFEDCMNEMHSITERDAFSYGFRLGVQMMNNVRTQAEEIVLKEIVFPCQAEEKAIDELLSELQKGEDSIKPEGYIDLPTVDKILKE